MFEPLMNNDSPKAVGGIDEAKLLVTSALDVNLRAKSRSSLILRNCGEERVRDAPSALAMEE
jgi:hypothetical protein